MTCSLTPVRLVVSLTLMLVILGFGSGPLAGQEPPATAAPVTTAADLPEAPASSLATGAVTPGGVAGSGVAPLQQTTTGKVTVAGVVDHTSLHQQETATGPGYTFAVTDGDGHRLQVVSGGAPPLGFKATRVVVVVGTVAESHLVAEEVLIPGVADWPDPNRGLGNVMVISMIVWLGLFAYLLWVDQKSRRLEAP